jgi:hypothetical protein
MLPTPITLAQSIRNKLNDTSRYHSGTISNGVAKAFDQAIISKALPIDKPNIRFTTANITTGNMYKISLGHAGSP